MKTLHAKPILNFFCVVSLTLALILSGTGSAAAHSTTWWHGDDTVSVGPDHQYLVIDDNECDGRMVSSFVWFKGDFGRLYDHTGGCGSAPKVVIFESWVIDRYRACENHNEGCTLYIGA